MISRHLSAITASILALSAFDSPAIAADCSGYDILFSRVAETTELSGGGSVTLFKAESVNVEDDPTSKYHLTAGSCFGKAEVSGDGSFSQSGNCTRSDKDGDTYSIKFAQEAGAEKGTWESISGTGKFANDNNSGWFQDTGAIQEGATFASIWGGNCN